MVSEIRLLDFFVQNLHLPEPQAREAVREFKAAEAELHSGVDGKIEKKFEDRRDSLATKDDVRQLEVRMEQNTNKLLIWLVGAVFTSAGLVVAIVKLME